MPRFSENYSVPERKVETRNKKERIRIKNIDLQDIQKRFDESIADVERLFGVLAELKEKRVDGSEDILRSQILFLDSALDFYIHEITKFGLVQIVDAVPGWNVTDDFKKFRVSLNFLKRVYQNREDIKVILKELNASIQYSSFMRFDAIKGQLMLIGVTDIEGFESFKNVIDDLSCRRNAIAHSSDRDDRGEKQDICEELVKTYVAKLKDFQQSIQNALAVKGK